MIWNIDRISSQEQKIVIVTGASSGIGLETTRLLAQHGATVIMAVRDIEKGEHMASSIRNQQPDASLAVLRLELDSIASIKYFSNTFLDNFDQLDLLINNAGTSGSRTVKTQEGFELAMGVNHLGHFALTGCLLKSLMKTQQSRVVTVSSGSHRGGTIELDSFHISPTDKYRASKLANILYALELQRRFVSKGANIMSLAAHPGASKTEGVINMIHSQDSVFFRSILKLMAMFIMQPPSTGALSILRAATDLQAQGGEYYGPGGFFGLRGHPQITLPSASAQDTDLAQQLWQRSIELTGIDYEDLQ